MPKKPDQSIEKSVILGKVALYIKARDDAKRAAALQEEQKASLKQILKKYGKKEGDDYVLETPAGTLRLKCYKQGRFNHEKAMDVLNAIKSKKVYERYIDVTPATTEELMQQAFLDEAISEDALKSCMDETPIESLCVDEKA